MCIILAVELFREWIYGRSAHHRQIDRNNRLPSRNRDAHRGRVATERTVEGRRGEGRRAKRALLEPGFVTDQPSFRSIRARRRDAEASSSLNSHHHGSPDTCDKQIAGRVQHRRRYRAATPADRRSGHAG